MRAVLGILLLFGLFVGAFGRILFDITYCVLPCKNKYDPICAYSYDRECHIMFDEECHFRVQNCRDFGDLRKRSLEDCGNHEPCKETHVRDYK